VSREEAYSLLQWILFSEIVPIAATKLSFMLDGFIMEVQ
jgi:hypothetical protein